MEDYRFTGNTSFLASWYPTMKASAQFFVDFMTPYDGYIVTNPTLSPENRYYGSVPCYDRMEKIRGEVRKSSWIMREELC